MGTNYSEGRNCIGRFKFVAACCLVLISFSLFAQDVHQDIHKEIYKIESLNPLNKYRKDLKFLDSVLNHKRVVFLGEASHGDGTSMEAKSMLINYLVQNLGFAVLILESNIYEMQKMNSLLSTRKYDNTLLLKAGVSELRYIKAGDESLINVLQCNGYGVIVNGLEIIYNSEYARLLKSDLISAGLDPSKVKRYETLLFSFDAIAHCTLCDKQDTLRMERDEFLNLSDQFTIQLGKKSGLDSKKYQFLQQTLKSNIGMVNWVRQRTGIRTSIPHFWEPRDKYLYENLHWLLSTVYPDKKIIVSTSTFHMTRNVSEAPTMVDFLSQVEREYCYFLPLLSYQGNSGFLADVDLDKIDSYTRDSSSLEAILHKMNIKYCMLDFNRLGDQQKQYINKLQMFPSKGLKSSAAWTEIYDGIFFIDTMTPNRCRYMTIKENEYFHDAILK